jgi:hypothetical protein
VAFSLNAHSFSTIFTLLLPHRIAGLPDGYNLYQVKMLEAQPLDCINNVGHAAEMSQY